MQYIPLLFLLVFLLLAPAILYLRIRLTRSRPSDYETIDNFLRSRGLTRIAVQRDDNYWRYWLRGKLYLSNCARIYIVEANEPAGQRREIHVAFDQWLMMGPARLQVLLER